MGVSIKRRKSVNELFKENFVDRVPQKLAFKKRLEKFSTENIQEKSPFIIFSGAGGFGKSALIEELEKNLYVNHAYYDFTNGTDLVKVLRELRTTLSNNYGIIFPLFDKGYINYRLKCGDISSRQVSDFLNVKSVLSRAIVQTNKTISKASTLSNFSITFSKLLEDMDSFVDDVSDSLPILNVAKSLLGVVDRIVSWREENARLKNDESYAEIVRDLNERIADKAVIVKEYLPVLFAKDLSDWLNETQTNLIIFLDNYQDLTGDEGDAQKLYRYATLDEDVPVDWWIELLLERSSSRVLWGIAGRSEISKIGVDTEVIKNDNLFPIDKLTDNYADEILQKVGVKESELRQEIIKRALGYPIALKIYVENYRKKPNPTINDLAENFEEAVTRLVNNIGQQKKDMVHRLCILGRWTDTIVRGIFSNLSEFSPTKYKIYKNLMSLALFSEQRVDFDEGKIFIFDKSAQNILLDYMKKDEAFIQMNFLTQTRDAANKFFPDAFNDNETRNNLYIKIWYEIILRTTDDAGELMTQYKEIDSHLKINVDVSVAESIVDEFKNKIEKLDGVENEPYIYFEIRLAILKFRQGFSKAALTLAESACEKVKRLPIDAELKIFVMESLADIYHKLEYFADEIKLLKEIISESEKFYDDSTNEKIIAAKNNLANVFVDVEKTDDAIKTYKEIYNALKYLNNERTMDAAQKYYSLAISNQSIKNAKNPLQALEKSCKRGEIDKDILDIFDDFDSLFEDVENSPPDDSEFLPEDFWDDFFDGTEDPSIPPEELQENLKIELNLRDEYISVYKKFYGVCSKETFKEVRAKIEFLADMYSTEDARQCWEDYRAELEQDLKISAKETLQDFVQSMQNYVNDVENDRYGIYQVNNSKDFHLKLVDDMKKFLDAVPEDVKIFAKPVQESTAEEKINLPTTPDQFKTLLTDAANFDLVLEKFSEILDDFEKDDADVVKYTKGISKILDILEHSKTLKKFFDKVDVTKLSEIQERLLKIYRKNFIEDAPEIIHAMEDFARLYENIKQYKKALDLYDKIIAMEIKKYADESHWLIRLHKTYRELMLLYLNE